jgi:hypothetical protein
VLLPVKTIASEVIAVAPNGPQVATHLGVRSPRSSRANAPDSEMHWIASSPVELKRDGCGSSTPSAPTIPAAANSAACARAAIPGVRVRTASAVSWREGL